MFLNLPRGCYWEFNWSISYFLLRALEKLILLLPNSLPPSHEAFSGTGLGLLTTMYIIHARQITVERVTFASQAWLSNAAPDFGREVGFIGVWAWCFPVRKPPLPLARLFWQAPSGKIYLPLVQFNKWVPGKTKLLCKGEALEKVFA